MKKQILSIAAVCAAAACLGACKEPAANEYSALNDMLALDYSEIVLTVTDTFGEDTALVSEYILKPAKGGVSVSYSALRFSELSLDSAAPEKITLKGEAFVSGDKVEYLSGDEIALPAGFRAAGLNFKGEYFGNAELTGNYLKADVKNAGGFMGSPLNCTDMKVFAIFLEVFYEIEITYQSEEGNAVKYQYLFNL